MYIISGARTPSGSFMGSLADVSAPKLGAVAIRGALEKGGISKEDCDEVFMGHVVQAGSGQAPARQASIFAGLPESVPSTTINKVCGSGMKSIVMGAQTILSNDNSLVVCGGMENMSMSPFLLNGVRKGYKFGSMDTQDSIEVDGLRDVYTQRAMGNCAEECVQKYGFSRQQQDEYAMESFRRAQKAVEENIFDDEIVPVTISGRKGDVVVNKDEGPFKVKFDKVPNLRPAFEKDGTITAANASTLNDGAAAVVLGGEKYKDKAEFKILSYAGHAQNPTWFTTAPVKAMEKCLHKAGLNISQIDLFEINEAFACVPMAAMKSLKIDHSKVNVYGGGVSLGHPIGCSGARIVVTLMNAMKKKNARYGMGSICIGGGEALSLILEKL